MAQQQLPPGQEGQGADGEPIRPEATRALAQVLGATSQAGAQNLLQMTGEHMKALFQPRFHHTPNIYCSLFSRLSDGFQDVPCIKDVVGV